MIEKAKWLLTHRQISECFDNGVVEFTCWLNDNGNYDGPWDQWHKSGGRRYKAYYKDGQLDGVCKSFYENGMLDLHKIYKNGKVIRDFENER